MRGPRSLVQAPLRNLSLVQVRHVPTVPFGRATGDTARIYRELERDFGVLAPPVALHALVPELLAASWMMLRETMLVDGAAPRAAKEAVAAAVSVGNECPFCTTMHSSMLDSLTSRPGGTGPGGSGTRIGGGAPTTQDLTAWVRGTAPRTFAPAMLPELAGTALCLHYLNRMVNIFLGPRPLPPHAPEQALGPVLRVLTGLMRGSARTGAGPGESLSLLPAGRVPPELAWAEAEPRIAQALGSSVRAVDRVAEGLVPAPVRSLVEEQLALWDGRDPGLGRAWLDAPLRELRPADRPTGELALLAAKAAYRVDDRVVLAVRQSGSDDRKLLATASWASLRAAVRRTRQLTTEN